MTKKNTHTLKKNNLLEWIGNTTYAAIAAVAVANIIVAIYIITALFEKPVEREKKE